MFINCPYCRALVATDPVTDQAPTHCPHCDSLLRRDPSVADADTGDDERPPLDLVELLNAPLDVPLAPPQPPHTHAIADDAREARQTMAWQAVDTPVDVSVAADDPAEAPVAEPLAAEPTGNPAEHQAAIEDTATPAPVVAPVSPRERATRAMPSFARRSAGAPGGPRERWVPIAVTALALLLVLQLLLADRARLAADAHWRPLLQGLCGALRCDLPPWREPTAFTLLQRDVRQHPTRPGALRVSATFRNDARWSQPWPRLTLTLSDANGRAAGERSFRAEEYLGGAPSQPELASGESATVAMDIIEPAPDIVGYDFGFR